MYRNRVIRHPKYFEEHLADYSNLYFGAVQNSYMVATLTVSGSQAICAALQTKLEISGDKQYLLKRYLGQLIGGYN